MSQSSTPATKRSVAKLFGQFFGSTVVWLLLLLVVVDVASQSINPLAGIPHAKQQPAQLTESALAYKAKDLQKLKTRPDVLVLGSSLPMAAIRYCDKQYLPQEGVDEDAVSHNLSIFQAYDRAAYLERELSRELSHPITVFNFTSAACMPSDAGLILAKAIDMGKKPKLVIIGFGPRDFMDNLVPEIGKTPAFNVLTDWSSLKQNMSSSLSFDTTRDLVLQSASQYFRGRHNWSLFLSENTTGFLRHPTTLAQAAGSDTKVAKETVTQTKVKDGIPNALAASKGPAERRYETWHIEDYKRRYNPPNNQRYAQELERFAHLLATCRDKGIAVVVVNMPITETNRQLIPLELLRSYRTDLSAYAAKFGAQYVDLNLNPTFTADDFLDTVHVNPQGGKKVNDALLEALSHSATVANALGAGNKDSDVRESLGTKLKKESTL